MIAALVPGQGKIAEGFFDPVCPARRAWYDRAEALLGASIGPDNLRRHDVNSALIVANAFALDELFAQRGQRWDFAAGYSVGQYAALGLAGAMDKGDVLALAIGRARLMQGTASPALGMVGTVGLKLETVEELREATLDSLTAPATLEIAGYATPIHFTVAGDRAALEAFAVRARAARARKVEFLEVEGAWHSSKLEPVLADFVKLIDTIPLTRPKIGFVDNVSGRPEEDPIRIRENLKVHLVSPVRWDLCVRSLVELGVTEAVELGAGHQLSAFLTIAHRGVRAWPVCRADEVLPCVASLA